MSYPNSKLSQPGTVMLMIVCDRLYCIKFKGKLVG